MSVETTDDVIELGEDGSFDISTPPKIKKQREQQKQQQQQQEEQINSFNSQNIPSEEILNLVSKGEYKIFSSKNSKEIFLIIHLEEDERIQKVYLKDDQIIIELNENSFTIDISNLSIDKTTIHSTQWKDYLTFKFYKQNS